MNTKWILVNVLLLVTVAGLSWQLRTSILRFREANRLSLIQPKDLSTKSTQDAGLAPLPPRKSYAAAEFDNIPAKNLFSELRAREEKTETSVVVETPPLAVKPVLVGITIMGNQRLAAIVDPASQGATRKTQTKRLGDSYQGYLITDITDNSLVLESGTRREVIPLYDTAKRAPGGGKTPIQATRIVAFGTGSAPGSGAIPAGSSPVAAQAAVPIAAPGRRPVVDNPTPGATQATAPGVSGITRPTTVVQPPAVIRQVPGAQAPAYNEGVDAQGRRVIRTPFGDIVREKPPGP